MRRCMRHFLTSCSIVSLLLCVAVCVLWVRSYSVTDYFLLIHRGGKTAVGVTSGQLYVSRSLSDDIADFSRFGPSGFKQQWPASNGLEFRATQRQFGDYETHWQYGDFELFADYSGHHYYQFAFAPCWSALVLLAIMPMGYAVSALPRNQRKRRGLCPACGYDLRASPERCPECGTSACAAISAASLVQSTP
jgi:hypothetical protein